MQQALQVGANIANFAFAVVFARQAAKTVLSHLRWRRDVRDQCKSELRALNSHAIFRIPLDAVPQFSSFEERRGNSQVQKCSSMQRYLRDTHTQFIAKWARAVKGRFLFADMCQDTAVNRQAVHRFLLHEWKAIGLPLHRISVYMLDAIELSFEPTHEFYSLVSKRKQKKFARMEMYNEKKALSAIK
jgi:hypothetical protein